MKRHLTIVLALVLAFIAQAQTPAPSITIKGVVIDSSTQQPLAYATVALQLSGTGKVVRKVVTRNDGSFTLKAPASTQSTLVLTIVGYADKTIAISSRTTDMDAGSIQLTRSATRLKEVAVNAAKPVVSRQVDRLTYDVQADPEVNTLSALDMMRKIPLLSVDGDDHIMLNGSGNFKILINGRESAMMVRSPSDVLKVMPATNIDKIEVITIPPAKYDAEGLTGIINIITKRRTIDGYNVGVNVAENTVFGPSGGVNGTFKSGKFGLSAAGFYGYQPDLTTNSSTSEYIPASDVNIFQNVANTRHAPVEQGGIDLSYEVDSLHLLTASASLYQNTTYVDRNRLSSTDSAAILQQGNNEFNHYRENYLGLDLGLNYQVGFKRSKNELLTISYDFSSGPDEKVSTDSFYNRFNYDASLYPNFRQYNNEGITSNTVQVDYAGPLSKRLSVEAGGKAIFRDDFSKFHEYDEDSAMNEYIINDARTNNFHYQQDVYSLYNSYQLTLDKWTGKGGLRLERTVVNADFSSESVSISPNYNNLIPSISLQRELSKASLNFGYTQRIQRPGISQLSPYVNYANPLFLITGNPGLRPELDNTFEMTYNKFGKNSIVAGVNYLFTTNSIQQVSTLRPDSSTGVKDTVNYTTFGNIGTNKYLGLNLNIRLNLSKAFSMGLNASGSRTWLEGSYNGNLYRNQGYTGNVFFNSRYRFDKSGFAVGLNFGYFSGSVFLQGHSEGRSNYQAVLAKDLLKKKATLSLNVNNVFAKYLTQQRVSSGPDFSQVSYSQSYYRSFVVRFSYRFGKLTSNIKRNQRGINNDDIKQSGDSGGQ